MVASTTSSGALFTLIASTTMEMFADIFPMFWWLLGIAVGLAVIFFIWRALMRGTKILLR